MTAGAALITLSSVSYFRFDELPPFVIEKLPVRFEALWLAALRVHVSAALASFPLCILLMTRALQRRARLHRWTGRVAGMIMLGALVPSGAVLAFEAKGGLPVTAGFLVSGGLLAWFLVRGVVAARRKQMGAHRRAMMHVFAQMSVAVTSRAMLFGLDAAGMRPELAYVLALWIPVLGSCLVTEMLSGSMGKNDVIAKVPRLVHARAGARSLARVGR